jgi:hypothetical protein
MNFTYLQHPCISSFHGKIHLLLTPDFYTQVHEMSLVPRKKTSHANVTFSRILCSSQIFSTTTSHSTHYESQKPQLCIVQVFDANRSHGHGLPSRVQKTFSSSFKCYNLKTYVVKKFEISSTYSHINFRLGPRIKFLKIEYFPLPFFALPGGSFAMFLKKHTQDPLEVKFV